jgi:hypothetical protein
MPVRLPGHPPQAFDLHDEFQISVATLFDWFSCCPAKLRGISIATPLPGFKEPANFENLTEVEFSPVRDSVLRFTVMASAEAVRTLNVK